MKYLMTAVVSGLIGLGIGYGVWGTDGALLVTIPEDTSAPVATDEGTSDIVSPPRLEHTSNQTKPAVTIKPNAISEEQKKLLESFGIDPEGITVTAEMITCAETTLGAERLDTILSGAIPTFFESAKLLGCYQQ